MHRILVVEDTPAYAEALERTLALEGHRVLLATRAQEALARASAEPPDLVVLDLGLPDRDGYHVLRELRVASRPGDGPDHGTTFHFTLPFADRARRWED